MSALTIDGVNVIDGAGGYLGVALPIAGGWHAGHDNYPGLCPRRATADDAARDLQRFRELGALLAIG